MDDLELMLLTNLTGVNLIYNNSLQKEFRSDSTTMSAVAVLYGLLFVVGLPSNLWVVATVTFELTQTRHERTDKRRQHILLHVLFLSVVDILCLLSLPVIMANMLSDFWQLGVTLCKLAFSFESPNKLLSNFILTAMAIHCYFAVCKPILYKSFQLKHTVTVALASVVLSTTCMIPVFLHTNVVMAVKVTLGEDNLTETYEVFAQTCTILADPEMHQIFIGYSFALWFGCTTLVQLTFYSLLITFVVRHKRRSRISRLPLRGLMRTILTLSSFYLICWCPFWVYQLNLVFFEATNFPHWAAIVIHCLPYINSAVNPALYSRINRKADVRHFSSFIWEKVHKKSRNESISSCNTVSKSAVSVV